MQEINECMDFGFDPIVNMLYSKIPDISSLAGSTLAAFAFNSIANQRTIEHHGAVEFKCFVDLLKSPDEYHRCSAAFQVTP